MGKFNSRIEYLKEIDKTYPPLFDGYCHYSSAQACMYLLQNDDITKFNDIVDKLNIVNQRMLDFQKNIQQSKGCSDNAVKKYCAIDEGYQKDQELFNKLNIALALMKEKGIANKYGKLAMGYEYKEEEIDVPKI